jgi:hypothetical protein
MRTVEAEPTKTLSSYSREEVAMKSLKSMTDSFRVLLGLMLLGLPSLVAHGQTPAVDRVTVYGINTGAMVSWMEGFEIAIDAQRRIATATETGIPVRTSHAAGGALLVVRADYYYGFHARDPYVYKRTATSNRDEIVLIAQRVSGYDGFAMGVADVSGSTSHLWANPWDGSNLVFEFVPDPTLASGWKVEHHFDLANAARRYDGMEVFGNYLYANRVDAGFNTMGQMPCAGRPNGIYDQYSASDGSLVRAGFIMATFPASGIAFNGTYFFVSDICNNRIAVYDNTGTFIASATLPNKVPGQGNSVCVNMNLRRCIEDLSILVSDPDNSGLEPDPGSVSNPPNQQR